VFFSSSLQTLHSSVLITTIQSVHSIKILLVEKDALNDVLISVNVPHSSSFIPSTCFYKKSIVTGWFKHFFKIHSYQVPLRTSVVEGIKYQLQLMDILLIANSGVSVLL